jgi:isopentenyl-diphosphate Delta-isomerase
LEQELGINPKDMPTDGFKYLTRLHYVGESDGEWGEHEGTILSKNIFAKYQRFSLYFVFLVDYILLIQKDVEIKPNPNEVRDVQYISKENLKKFIETHKEKGLKLTPWFALIAQNFLFKWWDHLDNLESQYDHQTVHHML